MRGHQPVVRYAEGAGLCESGEGRASRRRAGLGQQGAGECLLRVQRDQDGPGPAESGDEFTAVEPVRRRCPGEPAVDVGDEVRRETGQRRGQPAHPPRRGQPAGTRRRIEQRQPPVPRRGNAQQPQIRRRPATDRRDDRHRAQPSP
ncbi:hypothetical protein ACFYXC_23055 [Streptomyces sp. NPDC002701]|uniref:hypothetical protein n=1 Tax=Streptomyces sp. NPDC002701 TaxID=3364661 RepID=UPI0036D0F2C4